MCRNGLISVKPDKLHDQIAKCQKNKHSLPLHNIPLCRHTKRFLNSQNDLIENRHSCLDDYIPSLPWLLTLECSKVQILWWRTSVGCALPCTAFSQSQSAPHPGMTYLWHTILCSKFYSDWCLSDQIPGSGFSSPTWPPQRLFLCVPRIDCTHPGTGEESWDWGVFVIKHWF